MARLVAGDAEALGPLMERHHRRVYRIALAYLRNADDALDCVQETFVKAYQNAASFHPESGFGPWLTRIAVNQAIDQYRRGRRRNAKEEPLGDAADSARFTAADLPADQKVQGREIGERISKAVITLPKTQRAVFVLRHYQGLTLDEIAETLGVQLGTVKSALHRSLLHLRERLDPHAERVR